MIVLNQQRNLNNICIKNFLLLLLSVNTEKLCYARALMFANFATVVCSLSIIVRRFTKKKKKSLGDNRYVETAVMKFINKSGITWLKSQKETIRHVCF